MWDGFGSVRLIKLKEMWVVKKKKQTGRSEVS